jgi:hypothetical protein
MRATSRTPGRVAPVPLALLAAVGTATLAASPAAGGQESPAARSVAAAPGPAECQVGSTVVRDVMARADWTPLTPARWRFPGSEVVLATKGTPPAGPRRPYEYAVLARGPEFRSVQVDARVRLDTPVRVSDRDVVVLFGYQSPTRFYYVHLSSDNTIYPHNGIFVVNDADRLRIDDQWNGSVGARPAISDARYHQVRVRHCPDTGRIAVYVDGAAKPLMTATDRTLRTGRVGFGSFDNVGRIRDLTVTGTPADTPPPRQ